MLFRSSIRKTKNCRGGPVRTARRMQAIMYGSGIAPTSLSIAVGLSRAVGFGCTVKRLARGSSINIRDGLSHVKNNIKESHDPLGILDYRRPTDDGLERTGGQHRKHWSSRFQESREVVPPEKQNPSRDIHLPRSHAGLPFRSADFV